MGHRGTVYTVLCACLVGTGSFLYGYDSGIMSSMLAQKYFKSYFGNPNAAVQGGIVACLTAGAWLSNFCVGALLDRFGRRWSIAFGGVCSLIGGVLMTAANSAGMLMAGRVFAGLGLGSMMVSCSIYQAEISSTKRRALMVGLMQLLQSGGFTVANWTGYGCRNLVGAVQFRVPFAIQIFPPIVLLAFLPFLPESPRWLVTKGKFDQALAVCRKLSDKSEVEIEEEFELMKENILLEEESKITSVRVFFSKPSWRRRFYLASYMWTFVPFSGVNVINYYQTSLYKSMGFNTNSQLLLTGVYGTTGGISVAISIFFLLDRFGRMKLMRPMPILLAFFLAMSAMIQAIYPASAKVPNLAAQQASVAMLFLFQFAYGLVCSNTFIYTTEIFPMPIRAIGGSAAGVVHWSWNLIFNQISPIALAKIGWKYYFVFVALNLVNSAVFFAFFPETKGKTLEELNEVFGDPVITEPIGDIKRTASHIEDVREDDVKV